MATYNAALNRPVFASSVLLNYRRFNKKWDFIPSLANDGNNETNAYGDGSTASCFHSRRDDHYPWWAVDLGRPMVVYEAVLTGRGDCCGMMKYTSVSKL